MMSRNRRRILSVFLAALMMLSSCKAAESVKDWLTKENGEETGLPVPEEDSEKPDTVYTSGIPVPDIQAAGPQDAEELSVQITKNFSITTADGEFEQDGTDYRIVSGGEYTLSGRLSDGSVTVGAPEDENVTLVLNGLNISNGSRAPVFCESAKNLKIKAAKDSYNRIEDLRQPEEKKAASEDSGSGNQKAETAGAAVFSGCDIEISGHGALSVISQYSDGIRTKDDLSIKNTVLRVEAANDALRGNDSVTAESGSIILIAGGNGIVTSNSELSSSGNQKGNITILDGNILIRSSGDAVDSAASVSIENGQISLFTGSHAEAPEEENGNDLYIVISEAQYSENYDYYAYFEDADDGKGVYRKAEFETMVRSGPASFYGLKLKAPESCAKIQICMFKKGGEPDMESAVRKSDTETVNAGMNGVLLTLSGEKITFDWVTLSAADNRTEEKSVNSAKGIRAADEITVKGGTVVISGQDDGLHADGSDMLESGRQGSGCISVSGGELLIRSADDGLSADRVLAISGGVIVVADAYEGLEANRILISGGETFIYAEDDGVNACDGDETPELSVSGGYLDVTVPDGDTDAIDSNGSVFVTGGLVIAKGGASSGGMAGSIDAAGRIDVTGGTVIALGGICEVPSGPVNCYVSADTILRAGNLKITAGGCTVLSFETEETYRSLWIASEFLKTGTEYKLADGEETVLTWTQEEGTQGYSGNGFGGPGGPGAPGRPGGPGRP